MTESQLQKSIVRYLDNVLPKHVRYFAVPNGGKRNAITGALLKAEGVKAGVLDLCILWDGKAAFIELKTIKGTLQASQVDWLAWLSGNGFEASVCRSLDDVTAFLASINVPTRIGV